ncbi:MAG: HD domain-containing protein [Methanotrichaceae archaeon]
MCSIGDSDINALMDEIKPMYDGADPAHDFSHMLRVYSNAKWIGERECADMAVLLPAALLHDAGSGTKIEEKSAAPTETKAARDLLKEKGIPDDTIDQIIYAIEVHRFSKGTTPKTLEAKILQDADRLDALGAIGIARVFMTGGALGRALYDLSDPFCAARDPDDKKWNLDHFYRKLLNLKSGMHTDAARRLAGRRNAVLERYLTDLKEELEGIDIQIIEGIGSEKDLR